MISTTVKCFFVKNTYLAEKKSIRDLKLGKEVILSVASCNCAQCFLLKILVRLLSHTTIGGLRYSLNSQDAPVVVSSVHVLSKAGKLVPPYPRALSAILKWRHTFPTSASSWRRAQSLVLPVPADKICSDVSAFNCEPWSPGLLQHVKEAKFSSRCMKGFVCKPYNAPTWNRVDFWPSSWIQWT